LTRAIATVALLLVAVACGSASQAGVPSPSPSPLATSSANASPGGLVFQIDGKKYGTSAAGTITLTNSSGSFTVELKIHGLAADSSHVSHIHGGSCEQPGGILFALLLVVADGNGDADTTTTVSAKYPPASGHWYVVVHAGENMMGSNATYLLCGNLF
jgi:hypothetical protein